MSSLIYKLLICLLLIVQVAFGNDKQIITQYAGDIGKYSIGFGQEFSSWYSYSFHYGIVPPNSFQNKIETFTLKNNFHIYEYDYSDFEYKLFMGLGIFHVPGRKYETNNISGPKSDYYRQSSYRAIAYLSHEIVYKQKYSMYLESGVNDIWLTNSYNNDSIKLEDHVSLGLGIRYWFR